MAESSKRKTHAERVFEHLRDQTKALSAYQILDDLREEWVTAATTVYRALHHLVASGRVHRIGSLKAATVCAARARPTHRFLKFAKSAVT